MINDEIEFENKISGIDFVLQFFDAIFISLHKTLEKCLLKKFNSRCTSITVFIIIIFVSLLIPAFFFYDIMIIDLFKKFVYPDVLCFKGEDLLSGEQAICYVNKTKDVTIRKNYNDDVTYYRLDTENLPNLIPVIHVYDNPVISGGHSFLRFSHSLLKGSTLNYSFESEYDCFWYLVDYHNLNKAYSDKKFSYIKKGTGKYFNGFYTVLDDGEYSILFHDPNRRSMKIVHTLNITNMIYNLSGYPVDSTCSFSSEKCTFNSVSSKEVILAWSYSDIDGTFNITVPDDCNIEIEAVFISILVIEAIFVFLFISFCTFNIIKKCKKRGYKQLDI